MMRWIGTVVVCLVPVGVLAQDLTVDAANSPYLVDSAQSFGTVTVASGGELVVDATLTAAAMTVENGGRITHSPGVRTMALAVSGALTVNGDIDVSALGLRPAPDAGLGRRGETLDPATLQVVGGPEGAVGGSHGGAGFSGPPAYGDPLAPTTPGGGGGIMDVVHQGGHGGGVVRITADTVTLNGRILADGELSGSNAGGGAGGSIWITASFLEGPGTIRAAGQNSIGGGGGRVALELGSWSFTGSVTAPGAPGGNVGAPGSVYIAVGTPAEVTVRGFRYVLGAGAVLASVTLADGAVLEVPGAGTVLAPVEVPVGTTVELTGAADGVGFGIVNGTVLVSSAATIPGDVVVGTAGVFDVDAPAAVSGLLDVTAAGSATAAAPLTVGSLQVSGVLTADDEVHVLGDADLIGFGRINHTARFADMKLVVDGTLSIDSGSAIDVSGLGLRPGYRSPYGTDGEALDPVLLTSVPGSTWQSGGSHAGRGSSGSSPVFGDPIEPRTMGGGGGATGQGKAGEWGGGKIEIEAGAVVLQGSLLANGIRSNEFFNGYAGSGAGGSIYVRTGSLSGSGPIRADGGAGTQGGGGGRIALHYDTGGYSGALSVAAGPAATAGTIYVSDLAGNGEVRLGEFHLDGSDSFASLEMLPGTTVVLDGPATVDAPVTVPTGVVLRVAAADGLSNIEVARVDGLLEVFADTHTDSSLLLAGQLVLDARLELQGLTTTSSGQITHRQRDAGLELIVRGTMDLVSGSVIDVAGLGLYGGWQGTTTTHLGESADPFTEVVTRRTESDQGGSHGGLGGFSSAPTYDDPLDPHLPGGGGGGSMFSTSCIGGNGGGVVRVVAGVLRVDGLIDASGQDAISLGCGGGKGGGAGGSVLLDAVRFEGSGSVTVGGGAGLDAGGGGGGGLMRVIYDQKTFNGTLTAAGGGGATPGEDGVITETQAPRPPAIISRPPPTALTGSPWTYTALPAGSGPFTWQLLVSPAGASVDGSGVVSWTPASDGTGAFTLEVSNAAGSASQSFAVTARTPPSITSSAATSGFVGLPYQYNALRTATASGSAPLTWSLLAAPPGFAIDASSGRVSWTPTSQGIHDACIVVTNLVGSDQQCFTVDVGVTTAEAPSIFSVPSATGVLTVPWSYDADGRAEASGSPPLSWSLVLGPPGFSIDAVTGEIRWTPARLGSESMCIEVANDYGTDLQCFTVTVTDQGIPARFVSTPMTTVTEGAEYLYDADGRADAIGTQPLRYAVASGPAGLTIDPDTGLVTWTPAAAGAQAIALTVTNAYGSDTQSFTVAVLPTGSGAAPVIVRGAWSSASVGTRYAYDSDGAAEAAGDAPIVWSKVSGPPEFHIDRQTGLVGWIPDRTGRETITIAAENTLGRDEYTFEVEVVDSSGAAPVAVATITPEVGDAPLDVMASAVESYAAPGREVVGYRWDFGDGSAPSFDAEPTHTYRQPGAYVARLTVTDTYGATATDEAVVRVTLDGRLPPRARITASATEGADTLEVAFGCECADGASPITAYRWDFGDGSLSDRRAVTHLYGPGGYQVRLTVTDEDGLSATDRVFISVADGLNLPPLLLARAEPESGTAPLEVTYLAIYGDPDGEVVDLTWTFMDGTTSNDVAPTVTYEEPVVALVTVTVTDDLGLTSRGSVEVQVTGAAGVLPPQILSVPRTAGAVGTAYAYDEDGRAVARGSRPLSWSLGKTVGAGTVGAPNGMTVDASTGEIRWTPTAEQAGEVDVVLVVRNDVGASVQEWVVTVTGDGEVPPPPDEKGCGCGSAGGGALESLALVLALAGLGVRRRRRSGA